MATKIRVKAIHFNWFPDSRLQCGYNCKRFVVGKSYDQDKYLTDIKVVKITHYDEPGYGEAHYCTIWFDDGSMEIVYNLNRVFYETF